MLRFYGKDLKAVLTESLSRDRPVVLTCDVTVSLAVQDGERFRSAPDMKSSYGIRRLPMAVIPAGSRDGLRWPLHWSAMLLSLNLSS